MEESFTITAVYKNEERSFDAFFRPFGYSYTIMVIVEGVEVIYESDEEGGFRAFIKDAAEQDELPDRELLQSISTALEKAFR